MKRKRNARYYIALILLLALLPGACSPQGTEKTPSPAVFHSYKNIPGVTAKEIRAIESLKKQYREFSYGVTVTTEAFIDDNNAVGGLAQLLTERLSALFGIHFTPQPYGWDELNEKLDKKTLDFTSELSPTPERQQRYAMTDPIFNRTIKIFSNKNAQSLSTIAKERPVRVVFLEGSTTHAMVKNSWSMPFEARFLASEAEAPLLLQSETIDAYIDGSSVEAVFENSDFVKVSGYYPLRYSPLALTTARPELKPFIDVMRYQTTGKAVSLDYGALLPVMDGFEATRSIRALDVPNARTTPIVAMTANAFKEDIERCLASGMNDHTGKPIDVEALVGKIHQYARAFVKTRRQAGTSAM